MANGILSYDGIGAEVPYFRENFPKALRAKNGKLEFGIFPAEFSTVHRLRPGEEKTHELWLTLDTQTPPVWKAKATPSFEHLRQTHALGFMGPRVAGSNSEYETYID